MEWIMWAVGIWATLGVFGAMMSMFARARQSYYVDPLQPLRGALQGPFALWLAVSHLHRTRR